MYGSPLTNNIAWLILRHVMLFACFQYFPWTILEKDSGGTVVSSSGLVFAMLDEIASSLNFSYSVLPPDDNSFGSKKQEWSCLRSFVLWQQYKDLFTDLGLDPFLNFCH